MFDNELSVQDSNGASRSFFITQPIKVKRNKSMTNNRYARLSYLWLFKTSIILAAVCFGPAYGWCSGAKTHVDKGPVKARTFSFLDNKNRRNPDYVESNKEAHAMVQQALIHNLAAKGVTYSPTNADV